MVWWLWAQSLYPLAGAFAPAEAAASYARPSPSLGNETLATLAQHGAQACCLWSHEDGFYQFSDNWQRICGLPPAASMGQGVVERMISASALQWQQAVADLFSTDPQERLDSARITCQLRLLCGGSQWIDLVAVSIRLSGGRSALSLLVADVTAQKHLEELAHAAQRESAVAKDGRASFLSSMSHELRTPLNAILGFAQMLEQLKEVPASQSAEYLSYIRQSGEDLLGKINDLIEVADIDAHCCRLRESALNVCDIAKAAIEMHSHRAFARNITLCLRGCKAGIVIQGDRARLIHAISKLLDNAIRYAPDGSEVRIEVSASAQSGLQITIADSGAGIAPRQLSNIRMALASEQPYFQTDIDHVGVGLSVAHELVALHGGALRIESSPGRGVEATLTLPSERIVSIGARVKPKKRISA